MSDRWMEGPSPPARDFYYSEREAHNEYFTSPRMQASVFYYIVWSHRGEEIYATEVTEPGVPPISKSSDLQCLGRNLCAVFICRVWARPGDPFFDNISRFEKLSPFEITQRMIANARYEKRLGEMVRSIEAKLKADGLNETGV
jgi:hypothetical protein